MLLGAAEIADAAVESEIAALGLRDGGVRRRGETVPAVRGGGVLDHRVFSEAAVHYLMDNGYTCVLWNSLPHDWEDPSGWVDRALVEDVRRGRGPLSSSTTSTAGRWTGFPSSSTRLSKRGIEIVVGFPDSCVPIRRGHLVQTVAQLTMETAS